MEQNHSFCVEHQLLGDKNRSRHQLETIALLQTRDNGGLDEGSVGENGEK